MSKKLKPTVQAYAELQQAYDFFNERLFEAKLPPCLITFQRGKRFYGYYVEDRFFDSGAGVTTDEIALNPQYFATVPLLEILQTLVHEMVHLWQFRFGKPSRKCYHNREWAEKMKSVGLMPSSTGQPGGREVGQSVADYALPGGHFLRACAELLSTAFRITWMDRFPVTPGHVPTPAMIAGDPAVQQLVSLGAFSLPAAEAGPGMVVEQSSGAGSASNRSNRQKFTCAACGDNIWGKPTLANVKHGGDCGDAMFEAGD